MKDSNYSKCEKIAIMFVLLIVLIPGLLLTVIDPTGHKLIISDNKIQIKTDMLKIEDIEKIELIDNVNINSRVKGTCTPKFLRGYYKIGKSNEEAKIYVYRDKSPYIKIELADKIFIYNDKSEKETIATYEKILDEIK